ncbi:hypothetical protein Golax_004986 [Gossypium laxum]|uniref:DUF4283 domain-containing protein n=1 Tax=Gossypium laxum TaxID=34288 RepID=A0A7J8ZZA0_9ROSI|nr:hypothetical protein [Gossypium laxum]
MADVEGNFAGLSLEDEEEVVVQLASKRLDLEASFENCFVGSFLTSSVVNFQSMRVTLANVWHPIRGISISDLNKGIFLFRLYHKMDTDRIKAGGHGESFCPVRILQEKQDFILGWDISLRAPTRQAVAPKNVWLREEDMFSVANFGPTNFTNEEINEGPLP